MAPAPAVAASSQDADTTRAAAFVRALGGAANLRSVDACTTRLRLEVADNTSVDEAALEKLGAKAVVRPAPGSLQVVLGPEADRVASLIRAAIGSAVAIPHSEADAWLSALGGAGNVLSVEGVAGTRLRLELVDGSRIDEARLRELGAPGVMRLSSSLVHVVVGGDAKALAATLAHGVKTPTIEYP